MAGLGDVHVVEARGPVEALFRPSGAAGQTDLFGERPEPHFLAMLRPTPGAAERLADLARTLVLDPDAPRAEHASGLGGTPGCSIR
jgi:hypothetical protein